MGVSYPGYPTSAEDLANLRAELLNDQRATWAQLDTLEWSRLHVIGAIRRTAKLGMSFEAGRMPAADGAPPAVDFYHVCKTRPCPFKGGPRSSNTNGPPVHHVSAFVFTDAAGPAPAGPSVPAVSTPAGAALAGAVTWSWEIGVGVVILAFSLLSRVLTAVQEVNIEQVVTSTVKGITGFFL